MVKKKSLSYSLAILLTLVLGVSIIFPTIVQGDTQAQLNPTELQQTIDAGVNQLFQQTALAQTPIALTQTIAAAFDQALTATAVSLATPTPAATATPTPYNVGKLEVISVKELDLRAGPANTSAYLAPDGEHFAHWDDNEICIYTISGEKGQCVAIKDQLRSIDTESVRWSPDSRYLALTEEFFRFFFDPDIWVIDTTTGTLTDITDDQIQKINLLKPDAKWGDIDVLPVWSSDSKHVLFLRYNRMTDGIITPPALMRVAWDGSDLQRMGEIANSIGFAVYGVDWSADNATVAYNYYVGDKAAEAGAWLSESDGSGARQIFRAEENRFVPYALAFSPDSAYLMFIGDPSTSGQLLRPEDGRARAVATGGTGESILLNDEIPVWGAGWSPSGSAVIYLARDVRVPENSGLYLSAKPGEPGRLILQGDYIVPTSLNRQPIIWTAHNTLLLSKSPEFTVTVVRLG